MASENTIEENIEESSDIVHDFPCKPCSDDGKNIDGVNFCAECQTYFCQACITFHNRCFKTHTLFSKSGVMSRKVQNQQQSEGLMCDQHPGNAIQMYCKEHDIVCCAVCVAVGHRLCRSADFIPKLAKEILNGRDRKDVMLSLEEMKKTLHSLKSSKQEQIREVNNQKDELLTEIEEMKACIIARVEELEQASVKQVQNKHKEIADRIKTDIESVDAKIISVENSIQKIKEFKGSNESKLFVILNKAHEVEVGCGMYIENDSGVEYGKIAFELNKDIESVLGGVASFGLTDVIGSAKPEPHTDSVSSEASLIGEFNVKYDDHELYQCSVRGCCTLENGQIIIADSGSSCLKRLDESYNLRDSCYIQNLEGLCSTGPDEIAVLGSSNVQFIHVGKSMIHKRSFEISCELIEKECLYSKITGCKINGFRSIHIAYSNKKLYISAFLHYTDKNRTAVLVFDIGGSLLKIISTRLDNINSFSLSSDGCQLFFAIPERGIIILDDNGQIVSEVTDKRLHNVSHITEGENGQLLACDRDTDTIFLVDSDGKILKELLGRFDGLRNALNVTYIQKQKRIIITSDTDIRVFQMT